MEPHARRPQLTTPPELRHLTLDELGAWTTVYGQALRRLGVSREDEKKLIFPGTLHPAERTRLQTLVNTARAEANAAVSSSGA